MHPVTLTGARVNLREFRPDDLRDSMAVVGDPEVTRSLSFDARSEADQAIRLTADIVRAAQDPRPDYYLAVTNHDDLLVGFARIGLGRDRGGELGYAIRRADWGKGYATESSSMILDAPNGSAGSIRLAAPWHCSPTNRGFDLNHRERAPREPADLLNLDQHACNHAPPTAAQVGPKACGDPGQRRERP